MTNYYGIRNRLAILNENYVYADFKSRVWGCYYLINSLCDYVIANSNDIRNLIFNADKKIINRGKNEQVKDSFAIEYDVKPINKNVTIKTYEAEIDKDVNGWKTYHNTGRQKTVTVPYYIDFYGTWHVALPSAYILAVPDREVIRLLRTHGIRLEKLDKEISINADKFEITELKGSPRLNQGHYTNSVKGSYVPEKVTFPAGTVVIRMNQQLANVCAYLLEAQSGEGLLAWNYLDKYLVPQWGGGYNPYPVYRFTGKADFNTVPLVEERAEK
jgi:hypothetical protein